MLKDPIRVLITIFLISLGVRLLAFSDDLPLGGLLNRANDTPDPVEAPATDVAPSTTGTAPLDGSNPSTFNPSSTVTGSEFSTTPGTTPSTTPGVQTPGENRILIQEFQTECHGVSIYSRQGMLRMRITPTAAACQIVVGDNPALMSTTADGRDYRWQQGNVRARAFIPTDTDPKALELTGAGVPSGTKIEYAVTPSSGSGSDPGTVNSTYQQGYQQGFQRGLQEGRNFRRYGSGYNPNAAFQGGAQSGNVEFDQGFRNGFFAGFNQGYYNTTPAVPGQPTNPQGQLTCYGTVGVSDFILYYTPGGSFNRIELRPRTASVPLVSNLQYAGVNQQGQGVWQGNVNGMADVMVVLQSGTFLQVGGSISVYYDGQWGQGLCRNLINGWW